jgi:hypothetical protein
MYNMFSHTELNVEDLTDVVIRANEAKEYKQEAI